VSREPAKQPRPSPDRATASGRRIATASGRRIATASGRHVELTHWGGLDGLRGIAVAAVLLYHGGVTWAPGGFLGVEAFFVLSGFLITSLLLAEWARSAAISLGAFWMRRARRLLPALFCLVAVIGLYYAAAGSSQAIPGLKGDGISALTYYSNWHQIAAGASYFAASGPVSPLEHTWSLAIEEQFYLCWPILLGGVLWLASRGRPKSDQHPLVVLLGLSVAGVVASAIDTALLFDGGKHLDRVYYGTDTRAASLLVGASLAIGLAVLRARARGNTEPGPGPTEPGPGSARVRGVGLGAAVALAGVLAATAFVNGSDRWLYPYGLLGVDLAVVVLILAAVRFPASIAARALAARPLRAVGKISYGLYLWHFPLFLWLTVSSVGVGGTELLLVRLAATVVISVASYFLIEQPILQRRRPTWLVRALTPLAAGGAVAALLLASAADDLPVGVPAAATLPQPPPGLAGNGPACTITLKDAPQYGLAPPPANKETTFEYNALGYHQLSWSGTAQKTFQTCPPKSVLMVGDSMAFTLGLPWLEDEQRYGIQLADAALLGCAFTTAEGELDVDGTWTAQSTDCTNEVALWEKEKQELHAKAVVVELGYRDQFDWRIGGKVVHLGQPAFNAYVRRQIDQFVRVLGAGGTKILFLSVPYTNPPNNPDGSPAPAADPARHQLINQMLEEAAREHPSNVRVLDLDQTVSPGNHYNATVNGQRCRFDGVHFSVYCAELVEPQVLGEVRALLG